MIKSEAKKKIESSSRFKTPCLVESKNGSVIMLTKLNDDGKHAHGVVLHNTGAGSFPIGEMSEFYLLDWLKPYTGELLLRNE